ncbi:Si-specific NAD(P)(+) transhydrogenase [Nakamurella multipartita]|uniref:NAD(P)(+) transhydrogenase (Si-specific) n=1 Tax=Nakamurella multipartita (strain ATCC 700099 / DSM 44233 / CIP 104796 / JCM 9543 / NBRC 105858 / Y-104) TaxID=479431 RepID=C8XD82_NAKMY|nr:Si-specific NAD(P)(+) transhydrogenase [Nakamurella multipartita]ACV81572.1 pyridine nucleotide-disulfide oxidoreductase dimerization region [Nakamurella multipartita DSM 44233]
MDSYDMIVIGSGPAGQKAAIAAAKLGRRAAIVERKDMVGGVCINTGTIPSKTLREAVLYLTGLNQRELYGQSYRVKQDITIADLSSRTQHVIAREIDVIRNQLARNHVHMYVGTARFITPRTIVVTNEAGNSVELSADKIVIAVGTKPAHPSTVEFDGETIVDSDQILSIAKVPSSMVVVGAGVVGIEYASMFAALGTKVTIVERRPTMLDFCDKEIIEALQYQLRELAVTFRYSETVREVQRHPAGTLTVLESGKRIPADTVLYSAGRQGLTDELNIAAAGLGASDRGKIEVNENLQTEVEHIYAVGDVIGFPALAATAMEQGRRAAYHAFNEPVGNKLGDLQPIGIYTIPELSFVGRTEESLTSANVPFEVGVSRYRELARGAILGDSYGMLKILVHAESRELLGVHVFGTNATELVHIGQMVMGCGGTVDYLVDTVFNYPTLAESYKVAALDAVNKMRAIAKVTQTGPYHPLPE